MPQIHLEPPLHLVFVGRRKYSLMYWAYGQLNVAKWDCFQIVAQCGHGRRFQIRMGCNRISQAACMEWIRQLAASFV